MDFFTGWPFPVAVGALFVIVCLRAGGTYLLGRGLRRGAGATRLRRMMERPGYLRAERIVARWGALAVVLCFLTIGVQTMVNLVAGVGRMPARRYLPALGIGAVCWALIYATVGSVTWAALALLYREHGAWALALTGVLLAGIAAYVAYRVRAARHDRRARVDEERPAPELTHTLP